MSEEKMTREDYINAFFILIGLIGLAIAGILSRPWFWLAVIAIILYAKFF